MLRGACVGLCAIALLSFFACADGCRRPLPFEHAELVAYRAIVFDAGEARTPELNADRAQRAALDAGDFRTPELDADRARRAALDAGDARRFELDADQLPIVRLRSVSGAVAGNFSWRLAFVTTSTRIEAVLEPPETRERFVLLRATRMRGAPPYGDGRLELTANDQPVATIAVRWIEPPEKLETFATVRALRKERRWPEARAELAKVAAAATDPHATLQAIVEEARIANGLGQNEDEIAAWLRLAKTAEKLRVPSEQSRGLNTAAYASYASRQFSRAEALLDETEALDRRVQNTANYSRTTYYRGLITRELGDFHRAAELFRAGAKTAWYAGQDREMSFHIKFLGPLLQDEGLHKKALDQMREVATYFETRASPEDRASYFIDLGWVLVRGMAQGAFPADYDEPRRIFEQADEILRPRGQPLRRANVITNLMWVAYLRGDRAEAKRLLALERELDPKGQGYGKLFARIVEAELLLDARKFAEAEKTLIATATTARAEADGRPSDYSWRAFYGLGRARRAVQDTGGALTHFLEALRELTELSMRTELQGARAPFFDDHRQLIEDAIELLIERGDLATALAIADGARTTVIRSLESRVRLQRLSGPEREEWARRIAKYSDVRADLERAESSRDLTSGKKLVELEARIRALELELERSFDAAYLFLDEAAPGLVPAAFPPEHTAAWLKTDEALIAGLEVHGRSYSLLLRGGKMRHTAISNVEALLSPWTADLQDIAHLYLIAGALRPEELALQLRDRTVSFLPYAGLLELTSAEAKEAPLIVADPRDDLPHARAEGRAVAALFPDARFYLGGAARRTALISALDGARLFHFAGHGIVSPAQPWDSRLELAGSDTLTLEELFVAQPALGVVVLSGCDTARTEPLGIHERIGLPEAFLASGARAVLATDRPVEDREALRFVTRFYAAGGDIHPSEAYRRAAQQAIADGSADWTAFRLIGRR